MADTSVAEDGRILLDKVYSLGTGVGTDVDTVTVGRYTYVPWRPRLGTRISGRIDKKPSTIAEFRDRLVDYYDSLGSPSLHNDFRPSRPSHFRSIGSVVKYIGGRHGTHRLIASLPPDDELSLEWSSSVGHVVDQITTTYESYDLVEHIFDQITNQFGLHNDILEVPASGIW